MAVKQLVYKTIASHLKDNAFTDREVGIFQTDRGDFEEKSVTMRERGFHI